MSIPRPGLTVDTDIRDTGFSSVSPRDRMLLHQAFTQTYGKNFLLCAFKCRNYRNLVSVGQFLKLQSNLNNSIPSCGLEFKKKNLGELNMHKSVLQSVGGRTGGAALSHPVEGAVFFSPYVWAWVD